MIRVVSMFSGIGGFEYGFEEANRAFGEETLAENALQSEGDKPNSERGTWRYSSYRCVWANDNDKYACQIYRKNFGDKELYEGDIRTVDTDAIPEHDLLCAGFPCQSFSIAGKRRGFQDTRGTLFFEICRVIRAKRPSYLLLENVKGLLSHDDGRTFETIIGTLDELGYDLQWQVLNSKDFGVPQNRERVFIIGHTRGKPRPKVFPLGEDDEGIGEAPRKAPRERTRLRNEHNQFARSLRVGGSGVQENLIGAVHTKESQEYSDPYLASTLSAWYGKDGSENLIVHENKSGQRTPHEEAQALRSGASHNYQTVAQGINQPSRGVEPRKDGLAATLKSGQSGTQRPHMLEIANAVDVDGYLRTGARPRDKDGKPQLLPIGYRRIRRLTPLECERLQGFPDGWTEGISDTQRYKCLGNAVTVNVIEAIGRQLLPELNL